MVSEAPNAAPLLRGAVSDPLELPLQKPPAVYCAQQPASFSCRKPKTPTPCFFPPELLLRAPRARHATPAAACCLHTHTHTHGRGTKTQPPAAARKQMQPLCTNQRPPPPCLPLPALPFRRPSPHHQTHHHPHQTTILIKPPSSASSAQSAVLDGRVVELHVVQGRAVPRPVLAHAARLQGPKPRAVVVVGVDGAVQGVVEAALV